MAVEQTLNVELMRAMRREARRREGLRGTKAEQMAPWVSMALPEVVEAASTAAGSGVTFVHLLRNPEFLSMVATLLREGSLDGWFRGLDETKRAAFETKALPLVRKAVAERKPAERPELRAFYFGVRAYYHVRGFGEPRPSAVRDLAAARELEPIDGNLGDARVLWEDRIRRWRRKIDKEWTGWRDVLDNTIPAW